MRRLPRQGEVHHDPALPPPLHLPGLPSASAQVPEWNPHLSDLSEAYPTDDQSLFVTNH